MLVLPAEPISDIAAFENDFVVAVVALFELDAHIDTGSTVEELMDC